MLKVLLKDAVFIVLMVPIVICSYVSLSIIIERFFFFFSLRKYKTEKITLKIFDLLRSNRLGEAATICKDSPYYFTNILGAGIYRFTKSKEIIKESLENASLHEIPTLEKNLNFLGALAHVSPLLGLLGTVAGLVKSFYVIQQKTSGFGVVNPSDIAGGIWVALLTTVAGLSVAIISYLSYNYFVHKVNFLVLEVEKASTEILEISLERGEA